MNRLNQLIRELAKHKEASIASASAITLLLILCFSCRGRAPEVKQETQDVRLGAEPIIQVALARSASPDGLKISVQGPCQVSCPEQAALKASLPGLEEASIELGSGEMRVGGAGPWVTSSLRIVPEKEGALSVNGRHYHGQLRILAEGKGKVTVINALPLEQYLAGVLGSEVFLSWPNATLQAQAIAARTYALDRMEHRKDAAYHVVSNTADQAYRGMETESVKAREVMRQTRGVVLTYDGEIFTTYYHSTCGGHTCDARRGLGRPTIPPLSGVQCGFCRESRYYQWLVTLDTQEVVQDLQAVDASIKSLRSIELIDVGPEGRPAFIQINHSSGRKVVPAKTFRRLLGTGKLRSTWIQVDVAGPKVIIHGRGWGHGVGLCQWGAYGMAKAGYAAEFILYHYYPGAQLRKVYP